ncbi:serine/threonine protein kinase [Rosistilla carotiformis]|nr:serine/threonine-protein kinase [Rosistilla carotiformis]
MLDTQPSDSTASPAGPVPFHDAPVPSGADRYHGDQELGRGGWGVVMRANDRQLDRHVAVKQLGAHAAGNPDLVQRFLHEGLITAQLQHPGIVPVYERGLRHEDGQPFYAMKLLDGVTLEHKLRDYHCLLPGRKKQALLYDLLRSFVDICNAIGYAHEQQIIHRDLKPANVIVGPFGETVVVDWGLAKRLGADAAEPPQPHANSMATVAAGLPITESSPTAHAPSADALHTRMGTIVGTPAYMSPEQATGAIDKLGPHSDIYALGIILYEILTGRTPYHGDDFQVTIANVIAGNCLSPRQQDRSVPPPLDSICMKAIAPQPHERYKTALQIADDVSRFLAGEKVSSHRESLVERTGRACRRRPAFVAATIVGATILALSASITSVIVSQAHRAERRAKEQALAAHAEEVVVRKQAERERHAAHQKLARVQAAADDWLRQFNMALAEDSEAAPLRRDLLQNAMRHYRSRYHRLAVQPNQQQEAASCLLQIADLQWMASDFLAAEQTYQIAQAELTSLPSTDTPERSLIRDRTRAATGLLRSALRSGESAERQTARLATELQSLESLSDAFHADSESLETLAYGQLELGTALLRSNAIGPSIAALRRGLSNATLWADQNATPLLHLTSDIETALAAAYTQDHQYLAAAHILQDLIDRIDETLQRNPNRTDWLTNRAWAQIQWGFAQQALGKPTAAVTGYRQGLADLASAWNLPMEEPLPKATLSKQSTPWRALNDRCLQHATARESNAGSTGQRPWVRVLEELQHQELN